MNACKRTYTPCKKSIDTQWIENLCKIEGPMGVTSVIPNDNKDIVSRLIKALADRGSLPQDMDNPEKEKEVEAVDRFADKLYELGCELTTVAEAMMIGAQVEKAYTDISDETEGTHDWYQETGHTQGDF